MTGFEAVGHAFAKPEVVKQFLKLGGILVVVMVIRFFIPKAKDFRGKWKRFSK